MSAFAISQLLIGVAFVIDLACWQFHKREITLFLLMISTALVAGHFFLLGALTAALVNSLSATRYLVSLFTQHRYVMWFFIAIMLGVGIYTFDGVEDIFAVMATILGTLAAFQSDGRKMRLIGMSGTSSVLVHNVLIWTPAGVLLEIFFLASNALSYYRFYIRKQNH